MAWEISHFSEEKKCDIVRYAIYRIFLRYISHIARYIAYFSIFKNFSKFLLKFQNNL